MLIHGFPNDSSAWDPVVPELSRQYKLILPDLPGAGKSPLPATALSLEYMANCLKEVLDRENIRHAVLIGHSMGGYTALQFAGLFPERLKGISLVHSMASADGEEKLENRRKAIVLIRKGEAEKEMFLRGMAQNLFAPEYAAQHPAVVRSVVDKGMELPGGTLAAFYQAIMDRTDKRQVLAGLDFPIQWIIGSEDTATPMKEAMEQCHIAPVNLVSLYRNCGHMSFLEQPEQLIADLQQMLQYCYGND